MDRLIKLMMIVACGQLLIVLGFLMYWLGLAIIAKAIK